MNIVNIEDISHLQAKTIVTVGMFDGLHSGHRHLLRRLDAESAANGLEAWVVTFDRHPRQVLHPENPPALLSTYEERLMMLEKNGVRNVAIVRFTPTTAALSACNFTSRFLCDRLNMNMLLLGYDNMFGSRTDNDFDLLPQLAQRKGFGILHDTPVILCGVEVSSTKIRRALSEGNIRLANAMLGEPYSVGGTVVHGRHVGTGLGFPTANIQLEDNMKLLPGEGVYALRAHTGGKSYAAMANLGGQPTFHQQNPILEVHLIDFDGELYGTRLRVDFLERLRDIREFESPEELASQLALDREDTIRMFNKLIVKSEK